MTKVRKTLLVALSASALVVAASFRMFSFAIPCPRSTPVKLTGALVEVRLAGTVVPTSDPIFSVVPRCILLRPEGYALDERSVEIEDCYDSRFQATFLMGAP